MSLITKPNTFTTGTSIVAAEHNENFNTIYNDYNGSITNANISAAAAIAYTKLALGTSIVNSDISATAAIVDTKLAQITTASKVSGTALTGLASIPAGAGLIPTANLATVAIANGGTGQVTAPLAINALLPSQTTANGKFLTSNGSVCSWGTPTPAALTLVSTTTVTSAVTTGNIAITPGTNYKVFFYFSEVASGAQYAWGGTNIGGAGGTHLQGYAEIMWNHDATYHFDKIVAYAGTTATDIGISFAATDSFFVITHGAAEVNGKVYLYSYSLT